MASFMSSFFPGGKANSASGENSTSRPATPSTKLDNFLNPVSTPQGSPSKKTNPPGAHELPSAFDNALNLNTPTIEPPLRLGRPQSVVTPLAPGKTKTQPLDESSPNVDESVVHKTRPGSPNKKQGQENTPPTSRLAATESPHQHSHAAVTRQQLYEQRDRPTTPATKRFNTHRGLTAEEREILQKPNVKRLVNVTQLCKPLS
jgi:cell cycle protein kinase DBF2